MNKDTELVSYCLVYDGTTYASYLEDPIELLTTITAIILSDHFGYHVVDYDNIVLPYEEKLRNNKVKFIMYSFLSHMFSTITRFDNTKFDFGIRVDELMAIHIIAVRKDELNEQNT